MTSADASAVTAQIDRIEGPVAVLVVGGDSLECPLSWLPRGVAEGDAVTIRIERDEAATDAARARLTRVQERLLAADDGEDFSL